MATREEIKETLLQILKDTADKMGMDSVYMACPRPGKNSWTVREYIEAVEQDKCLEEGANPIDDVINLEKYLNENGRSLFGKKGE